MLLNSLVDILTTDWLLFLVCVILASVNVA